MSPAMEMILRFLDGLGIQSVYCRLADANEPEMFFVGYTGVHHAFLYMPPGEKTPHRIVHEWGARIHAVSSIEEVQSILLPPRSVPEPEFVRVKFRIRRITGSYHA